MKVDKKRKLEVGDLVKLHAWVSDGQVGVVLKIKAENLADGFIHHDDYQTADVLLADGTITEATSFDAWAIIDES